MQNSFGTLLKLGDGGTPTETFTTIAEVGDIAGPNVESDSKEGTNHSSPSGYEEFIPTIKRTGEVTFPINWNPAAATHSYSAGLLKDAVNQTKRNFQIVFPTSPATTWSFSAYVMKFSPKAPVNGILAADITLKVTGAPTLA
jgi:hypothetical protein